MDIYKVLLVVNSIALALFLVVAIVVFIKLVQIMNHVKRISERAEHLTENVENVSKFFASAAGPIAFGKIISSILKRSKK